ncbi:hypothetical protein SBDP1_270008 [Syntrophobacter sp. SbD1]|nr:hypothetical protein SBDP1_270008 [Syntrophobacter sp. SbD1]
MPDKQLCQSKAGAGIDFRALELEIDREIDALFVPAAKRDRDEDSVNRSKQGQPPPMESEPLATNAQSRPTDEKGGLSFAPFEASAQPGYDEEQPDYTFDSRKYQSHELSGLIEQFNAAYLSLDWEFSRENIQKFIVALNRLEPFTSRSSEAKYVLRIMDVILRRLLDRPRAVNGSLVQLIRDSQGLLAHMILMEGETGPHEKQRLKDLIGRFQELRRRALAVKAGASGVPPQPGCALAESPRAKSGWTENVGQDNARPTAHKRLQPVHEDEMQPQRPGSAQSLTETTSARDKTCPAQATSPARREDLCFIASYGKCIALPASCILKVARSTAKTGLKILKRGHATLSDFKPRLRSIKHGVLGDWANMPAEALKSYRFEPLGLQWPNQVETSGPMAVLASDGQTHWIVFCEIVNFIADVEIGAAPQQTGNRFGPFENKSQLVAPIFEPAALLSSKSSTPDNNRRRE